MDDFTAFAEGRNKELPGIAEKVSRERRMDAEEKDLKLSITEEGQNKVVAPCCFHEE